MKKKDLILRITFLSLFLIISTLFVYMPKKDEFAGALSFLTTLDNIVIEEVTEGIVISKTYPVADEVGFEGKDTIFKVKNYNNKTVKYQIKLEKFEADNNKKYMDITNFRYSYKINDGKYTEAKNVCEDGILDIEEINKDTINTYNIKFWVDENSDNSVYGSTISVAISLDKIS